MTAALQCYVLQVPGLGIGIIETGTPDESSCCLGSLEIKTNNGTVTFVGTVDPTGSLSGTYTVSSGTCDQTGTTYLVLTAQWDY
jgi:hypothetical protein